jgi:hypothetical protein
MDPSLGTLSGVQKWSAVLLASLMLLGAACGGDDENDPQAPESVEGIIVNIEGDRLDQIESFRLKRGDDFYEIKVDPDREYGFNLGHLHEHLANSEPVVVELDDRGGELFAVSIEDA